MDFEKRLEDDDGPDRRYQGYPGKTSASLIEGLKQHSVKISGAELSPPPASIGIEAITKSHQHILFDRLRWFLHARFLIDCGSIISTHAQRTCIVWQVRSVISPSISRDCVFPQAAELIRDIPSRRKIGKYLLCCVTNLEPNNVATH